MRYLLLSVLVVCVIGVMIPNSFAMHDFLTPHGAGELGDEHEHASLLVRIFGDKFDFTNPAYQIKSSWIHFEDSDGTTIHRHASGVTLGDLFDTLNIEVNSQCYIFPDGRQFCTNEDYSLKYYINNQIINSINYYVINDDDRILITYGSETPQQIEEQLKELDAQVIRPGEEKSMHEPTKAELVRVEFSKIKTEVYQTFTMVYPEYDELEEMFDYEKLRTQLSPETVDQFVRTSDPRSAEFGNVFYSPTVTTEEKQILLEMYEKLNDYFKRKVKDTITNIDKAYADAEIKINAMDISQERKTEYISELQFEVKEIKNGLVSASTTYIVKIDKLIEERKSFQKTELELTGEGGGCLIATAAFGSEMAPQVQFLRELRDNTVLQTESGTSFMTGFNQFYYSFSPAVADYERENPAFKEVVKVTLTPLLSSLTLLQYADIDSESEMLGYGISIILLNIGMYFVAPAVLIMAVRKRISK